MKLPEEIKKWWPVALISALLGGIGILSTSIWQDAAGPFLERVVPAIKNQTLLLLCLLLCLVIVLLVAWICFLLRADKTDREKEGYHFDQIAGVYLHEDEKKASACPRCWPEVAQLRIESNGWRCLKCSSFFADPSKRGPSQPSGNKEKLGW